MSTTSTIVLVREIDKAGRERGEEPNDDGISKEGDGIVSLEMEGPFSFDRRSRILTVSPNCSRTIKEDWSGVGGNEAMGVTMSGSSTGCSTRLGLSWEAP